MESKSGFFVDERAIKYRELSRGGYWDRVIIPKEIFIDAYNKWIRNEMSNYTCQYGEDDADDWSDD